MKKILSILLVFSITFATFVMFLPECMHESTWSPDGEHIAYTSGKTGENYDILKMGAPPTPLPVGGKAIPITLPTNNIELLASYIGLTILLVTCFVTIVYVRMRERNTEINS
jgi:hypothetical protein